MLFPDLRHALRGVRQLSIVPIRGMSALPVAMLEPFGDGAKTIDLFSVNFLAFLSDVKYGPHPWPRGFKKSLVVGNPRPSLDHEYEWSSLEGAELEAKNMAALYGGELLLRDSATKQAVGRSIETADLIYFAAHGYSDPRDALDGSYLVLGDGRLTARDVQRFKFSEQPLVVLSACQTGEGQIMEAGIVGLARAFQIAKARNTVMSLWAVDDSATAKLMGSFARRLKVEPPAEAMRTAMLEYRRTDDNPAHWAAFNIFGNRGTMRF
jgi:CHAT domain-containing protein